MRIGTLPLQALDDADRVRALVGERHEIDQPHASLVGVEFGLEHQTSRCGSGGAPR